MKPLDLPKFDSYEEEAAFWDGLDTSDYMSDDGEWFQFETAHKRALRVAILPEVLDKVAERAQPRCVDRNTRQCVSHRTYPRNRLMR